jgi:hypothetical protein
MAAACSRLAWIAPASARRLADFERAADIGADESVHANDMANAVSTIESKLCKGRREAK